MALFGALAFVAVVFVMMFSREGLGSIGGRFMTALAKHDVDTLTKMTYLGKDSPDQIKAKWDLAVNQYGKYYRFRWKITGTSQATDDSGSVRMQVSRNADSPGTYEENYQLPLVKHDGEWKVDVAGISREMFPGLPN